MTPLKVWDLPVRLTHWLLVLLVLGLYLSAESEEDWMDWHRWMGYAVLTLVLFRLLWGLVGSHTARFSSFVRGPVGILRYLRGESPPGLPGHNPLGALSVLALLAVLAFQAGTGLFASDDILFEGPLYDLVDSDTAERLTGLHHFNFDLLLILIGLHLVAIVFYLVFKRDNLVGPMLTGYKTLDADGLARAEDARVHELWLRALVCLALCATVVGLVTQRVLF
ncbi:MAG: cytochrome b/b6 domain-containing protein [Gammaproteobacteria bacterium]|nr:cytochrome b/b6 domain-containing protein [Gammaproteobacteria bacterium]